MEFRSLARALAHDNPSQVTTLHLSNQNIMELPKEIGKFNNLRVLNLEHNNLGELPEEIGDLRNLTTLLLNSNVLKTLPYSMKNLSRLIKLEIKRNDLVELPDIFENMPNLRELDVKQNRLNTLPPSFQCLNIQDLDVRQNGFTTIPSVIFHIPSLIRIQGIGKDGYTSPQTILNSFNKAFEKTTLDTDRYREAFSILTEDENYLPLSILLELLQINYPTLRSKILDFVLRQSQNVPLEKGMMVAVLGSTSIEKQEIKAKLKEFEIGYDSKIIEETTHIVLGNTPKLAGVVDDSKKYTIWSEKDLNNYFETIEKPYLLEVDDNTQEQTEQISRLLLSEDPTNIGIAIQILKGGGVPENLIEEIFLSYKICGDSKTKVELKKLLQINASSSVIDALSKRDVLFDLAKINKKYPTENTEKDLFKAIKKYSSLTDDLDWSKISYLIQEYFGYGARYLFAISENTNQYRHQTIKKHLEENKLDFNSIYSKGQPDLTFSYTYPYYVPRQIPVEIFDIKDLEELNLSGCYVATLPQEIAQLNKLKHLNLANNFIQQIPSEINQLVQLEYLDISQNEFRKFPMELLQLLNLKKCIVRNNRRKWENRDIVIPEEVYKKMPNCSFEN